VQAASEVLLRLDPARPDPASLAALQQLVARTGSMCHYVALLCGDVMTQVRARAAGCRRCRGVRAAG
jgi:hypothetical protein